VEVHITKGPSIALKMDMHIPIPTNTTISNDPHTRAPIIQAKGITTNTMKRTIGE